MTNPQPPFETTTEWVHVAFKETSQFAEVYGFAGSQGIVNLEGVRLAPRGKPSKTLVVMMHPSTSLQFLPVPRALAAAGIHVLCAGNRYFRNDTPLIMEKVALDLGAYIRTAREQWGYEKVVLLGWSGGGSLSLFYQSQAQRPTVTTTPAGDPVDLRAARLIPADAVIFQAANVSRAALLSEWLDPSVLDENDPDKRDLELNIYDPKCPNQPPYSSEFIARYRAAQLARMRRRTSWVKQLLADLRRRSGAETERGFVTHCTMADLRFMDALIDANDRKPGWCYLGQPAACNQAPAGLARFSTLRAWLSQWSLDDTNVNGPRAADAITVPMLVICNSADDAVPAPDPARIHAAASSADRSMVTIAGANHYYQGQPELLRQATETCIDWMAARNLAE